MPQALAVHRDTLQPEVSIGSTSASALGIGRAGHTHTGIAIAWRSTGKHLAESRHGVQPWLGLCYTNLRYHLVNRSDTTTTGGSCVGHTLCCEA